MGTALHLRTINQTRAEESNNVNIAKSVETAFKAYLGCGQLSVGGEVTNRVTNKQPCSQRQCGAVGVDSAWGCSPVLPSHGSSQARVQRAAACAVRTRRRLRLASCPSCLPSYHRLRPRHLPWLPCLCDPPQQHTHTHTHTALCFVRWVTAGVITPAAKRTMKERESRASGVVRVLPPMPPIAPVRDGSDCMSMRMSSPSSTCRNNREQRGRQIALPAGGVSP
jgi:hypothetical protein